MNRLGSWGTLEAQRDCASPGAERGSRRMSAGPCEGNGLAPALQEIH